MTGTRQSAWAMLPVGVLLLLAVVTRFYRIDHWSLFSDEIWSAMASRDGSLWDMLRYVYFHESHPPGYHLLMRAVQAVFGISDTALRFPSLLAGVALVYAVYHYGCRWLDRRTGVLAALLVCGSYYAIYYSQEARAYALLMLAVMLYVHALTAFLLAKPGECRPVALLIISATAAAYLHYAGVVYVACGGLLVLAAWLKTRDAGLLRAALWAYGGVLLLYSPWLPGFFYHLVHGPVEDWQQVPDLKRLWETWRLIAGHNPERALLLACVATAGVVLLWRRQPWMAVILLLLTVLPVMIFFIKSQFSMPVYNTRSFTPAIPLVALAAAWALTRWVAAVPGRYGQAAWVGVLLLVCLVQWTGNLKHQLYTGGRFKQHYRQAVALVFRDPAVAQATQLPLLLDHDFFNHYIEQYPPYQRSDLQFAEPEQLPMLEQQLAERAITHFYFLSLFARGQPEPPLREALDTRFQRFCDSELNRVRVTGYTRSSVSTASLPPC